MNKNDTIDMIQRCIDEIRQLRGEIARLAPKAEAYNAITSILSLLPKPTQGAGEDIIWWLTKQIDELRANDVKVEP